MDIIQVITQELKVEKWQVEAAVKLIDEGNTIPFISRYRKEATGSLNDEQLRTLFERLTYLRNLEDKKNQVLKSIEDQGKLTEELKKQILDAQTLVVVEDLYRPYPVSYTHLWTMNRGFCRLSCRRLHGFMETFSPFIRVFLSMGLPHLLCVWTFFRERGCLLYTSRCV